MDIEFPQILFQIINFGVVAGALTYLLYKPILKILEERSKKIEEGQLAAEKAIAEQSQVEDMKKKIKQQAEREATAILEEASKAAAKNRSEVTAKAKAEALKEVERLRSAWHDEKQKSMQDMKSQFADAVLAATQKVLGASLDTKAQSKLIDDSFSSLLKSI